MKSTIVSLVGVLALLGIGVGGALALRNASAASETSTLAMPLTFSGSGASAGKSGAAQMATMPVSSAFGAPGEPNADGLIYAREYRHWLYEPNTGMSLFWQNDATTLYVGLISPGTGCAAVGFGGRDAEAGANIIIGCVRDGDVTLEDHYGVSRTQHRRDRVSSLLEAGGTELHGETTLEFAIPLASGDPQDVDLVPGKSVAVILARHQTRDDLSVEFTCCGTTWIPLD
ncbi:MAG: DOMON domain-containing protein [Thermotogota bacterium]